MKLIGKYLRSLSDKDDALEITFKVDNHFYIRQAQTLNEDDMLKLEISVVKQKRSLEANRLMWALLNQLEVVTKEEAWDWYCKALEETNAHYDYLLGLPIVENSLRKQFRAVKVVGMRTVDDKELMMFKVFEGSSKYTIKEMTELIDTIMRYCYEHDIDPELYKFENM